MIQQDVLDTRVALSHPVLLTRALGIRIVHLLKLASLCDTLVYIHHG